MNLRTLAVRNYSVFEDATFDLATKPDRPVILFSGSNGAGKTSLLEALYLALHGRRSFVDGITDSEYQQIIAGRFHRNRVDSECTIQLVFDHEDGGRRQRIDVKRSWLQRRERIAEELFVSKDGIPLSRADSEELLISIIPPEVLRYFFFDGETIKELAEWSRDDDLKLFASVDELLGLSIVEQLERDLDRITISSQAASNSEGLQKCIEAVATLEANNVAVAEAIRSEQARLKAASRAYNEARQRFMAIGGLAAEERESKTRQRDALRGKIEALAEEVRREATSYMPLLALQSIRVKLLDQLAVSARIEETEAVSKSLTESQSEMSRALKSAGIRATDVRTILQIVRTSLLPKPVALSAPPLPISIREAKWMESVIEAEVPRLAHRLRSVISDYRDLTFEHDELDSAISKAPTNDSKVNELFDQLNRTQRDVIAIEQRLAERYATRDKAATELAMMRGELKRLRNEQFKNKRLIHKERLLKGLRAALPTYAIKLRASREAHFSSILTAALTTLWHKKGRLSRTEISFSDRTIRLFSEDNEIKRAKLSAAEKQLFAIAFIYAVARLSGRELPFVIDTPVGRLDQAHRKNLVNTFLPSLSHQIVLFSTDTEIVGSIYKNLRPLISNEYDLSQYNGRITEPIQLEVAL